jgi:hypothetical protein
VCLCGDVCHGLQKGGYHAGTALLGATSKLVSETEYFLFKIFISVTSITDRKILEA